MVHGARTTSSFVGAPAQQLRHAVISCQKHSGKLFSRIEARDLALGGPFQKNAPGAGLLQHAGKRVTARSSAIDVEFSNVLGRGEEVAAAKLKLLQAAAAVNRGALASGAQRAEIVGVVQQLEALDTTTSSLTPADLERALLGSWRLVYSSVEAFRSSPFFWAFQEGLVKDRRVAGAIFRFTDWIPGATIGQAYQAITPGRLESRVGLEVFPGLFGEVVTACRIITPPPLQQQQTAGTGGGAGVGAGELQLVVESTRIEGSNYTQFLEGIAVPVEQLIGAVRGPQSTEVRAVVTYLDQDMRVTRTQDGETFVYTRA